LLKCANSALPILAIDWLLPAIGVLIWRIFPTQLNDPELIRGSLVEIGAIPGILFRSGRLLIDDQIAVVEQAVEYLLIAKCTVSGQIDP
jgi:hypothetical protein